MSDFRVVGCETMPDTAQSRIVVHYYMMGEMEWQVASYELLFRQQLIVFPH